MEYKNRIIQLTEEYGTLELLTAYLMRTYNISFERADDNVLLIDTDLERMYEEHLLNDEDEEDD